MTAVHHPGVEAYANGDTSFVVGLRPQDAVAAPLSDVFELLIRRYGDAIAIARDGDHFVDLVREAVDGKALGNEQTRRARVEGSTWDGQADELVALGEGLVP